MVPLTADDTRLLKELQQFAEPVGVFDPSGKLLGLYVPADPASTATIRRESPFDQAELKRRLATEGPRRSFTELVGRVKLLSQELNRRRAAGERDFTLAEAQAFLAARPT